MSTTDPQWTLDNIYTIARREVARLSKSGDPLRIEVQRWGHVLRLCELAGCKPRGVLRDNGGSVDTSQASADQPPRREE